MAKVVLGFGSSHGPTIRTQPEDWEKMGQRDQKDPRYDYAELLKNASPSLVNELTMEKKRDRYNSCQAGIAKMAAVVNDAAPDVVVVISNQHSVLIDDQLPVMSIYRGESLADRPSDRPRVRDGAPTDLAHESLDSRRRCEHDDRTRPARDRVAHGIDLSVHPDDCSIRDLLTHPSAATPKGRRQLAGRAVRAREQDRA